MANAQAVRLFGHSRQELAGQAMEILVPQRFRKEHPGHRNDFFGDPRTRPMGSGLGFLP